MVTKSFSFTNDQSALLDALVESQLYNNQSEVVRQGLEKILADMAPARRLLVAVSLYKKHDISISRAAEVANVPFHKMQKILKTEGILRRGNQKVVQHKKKGLLAGELRGGSAILKHH